MSDRTNSGCFASDEQNLALATRLRAAWRELEEMAQVVQTEGVLVLPRTAAKLLDLSPARISQLTRQGRLRTWHFHSRIWLCERDLRAFRIAVEVRHPLGPELRNGD